MEHVLWSDTSCTRYSYLRPVVVPGGLGCRCHRAVRLRYDTKRLHTRQVRL